MRSTTGRAAVGDLERRRGMLLATLGQTFGEDVALTPGHEA